jgi:hypothetical protein
MLAIVSNYIITIIMERALDKDLDSNGELWASVSSSGEWGEGPDDFGNLSEHIQ